jgi:hypothetical protein
MVFTRLAGVAPAAARRLQHPRPRLLAVLGRRGEQHARVQGVGQRADARARALQGGRDPRAGRHDHFVVDADPEWGLVDPAACAWSTQQISLAEPPLD